MSNDLLRSKKTLFSDIGLFCSCRMICLNGSRLRSKKTLFSDYRALLQSKKDSFRDYRAFWQSFFKRLLPANTDRQESYSQAREQTGKSRKQTVHKSILIQKARGTLDLPQNSRANPVQCYSTHQEKLKMVFGSIRARLRVQHMRVHSWGIIYSNWIEPYTAYKWIIT